MKYLYLLLCTLIFSCALSDSKKLTIMDKIVNLEEYIQTKSRIDSLHAKGVNVKLSISTLNTSIFKNDSISKNIATILIEENYGFDRNTRYYIEYDSLKLEVVDVIKGF